MMIDFAAFRSIKLTAALSDATTRTRPTHSAVMADDAAVASRRRRGRFAIRIQQHQAHAARQAQFGYRVFHFTQHFVLVIGRRALGFNFARYGCDQPVDHSHFLSKVLMSLHRFLSLSWWNNNEENPDVSG
jgi:hypothetical protein